jgi:hypothetical protein
VANTPGANQLVALVVELPPIGGRPGCPRQRAERGMAVYRVYYNEEERQKLQGASRPKWPSGGRRMAAVWASSVE